jgi:hypothetical protein
MNSADSIRGVVGIWVFSFGVPLLATATRPFRRKATGVVGVWERSADVVLIALFGAWAAGAMFSSLPGLIGYRPDYASRVSHIQIVVLVALVSRYILENMVAVLAPSRLKEFSADSLPDASKTQVVISSFLRTAAYIFVASVFIGNNWALWVGGAIYLIPKLVALVDDALPNFSIIHRYMPRGILKVVFMLFVARWWGNILGSQIHMNDGGSVGSATVADVADLEDTTGAINLPTPPAHEMGRSADVKPDPTPGNIGADHIDETTAV